MEERVADLLVHALGSRLLRVRVTSPLRKAHHQVLVGRGHGKVAELETSVSKEAVVRDRWPKSRRKMKTYEVNHANAPFMFSHLLTGS